MKKKSFLFFFYAFSSGRLRVVSVNLVVADDVVAVATAVDTFVLVAFVFAIVVVVVVVGGGILIGVRCITTCQTVKPFLKQTNERERDTWSSVESTFE